MGIHFPSQCQVSSNCSSIQIRLFSKCPRDAEPVATLLAGVVPGPSHPRRPSLSSDLNGGEKTQESGLNALKSIVSASHPSHILHDAYVLFQGLTRDPVGRSQDTQPLHGKKSQPSIENRNGFRSQDSPTTIEPYSQAVKLRIEHARQRAHDFPRGAPINPPSVSCECESPNWAFDSNEIMVSQFPCS